MCEKCRQPEPPPGATRRTLLRLAATATLGLALGRAGAAKALEPPPKPQNALSPDASLARLLQGNERYVQGRSRHHDFRHEREALVGGQNPYAGILSCADSRIAPEYAFDTGRGDLFVEMKVQTPARLTKRQRELLQELHSTLSVENTPVSRSLLNKVKDIFG